MTKTQHTPGAWKAQRDIRHAMNNGCLTEDSPKAWAVYGNGYRIACISENIAVPFDQDIEAEANARLIAAAPKLLAALRTITDAMPLHGGMVRFDGDELEAARAAIAQATPSPDRYQIQVEIGGDWECGEWIEADENGITGDRIESTHATRAEAQAELDDMFAEMERQGMDFARSDWRVACLNEGISA